MEKGRCSFGMHQRSGLVSTREGATDLLSSSTLSRLNAMPRSPPRGLISPSVPGRGDNAGL